jgi:membrane protein involved in colicin uptake
MACIVDLVNPVKDDDKWVSNTCTIIKMVDASKALRTFACDCAERALKLNNVTNERSWNAITVSRLYNEGKATKGELADARGAARAAARDAAWDAAREAAWDAAWVAARDAARAAAWDAAWAAAWDAERAWQKRHLNKLMKQLFEAKNGQGGS